MLQICFRITPLITCHLMQIYHSCCNNKFWSIFPLSENFEKVDPDFTKSSLNFAKQMRINWPKFCTEMIVFAKANWNFTYIQTVSLAIFLSLEQSMKFTVIFVSKATLTRFLFACTHANRQLNTTVTRSKTSTTFHI